MEIILGTGTLCPGFTLETAGKVKKIPMPSPSHKDLNIIVLRWDQMIFSLHPPIPKISVQD
jgi:hypothetical protein